VKLRLTEAARDDLRTVYSFYAERSPTTADRAVGAILKAANGLTRFPLMGKHGAIEGTRERVVMRFPYRIVYRIETDDVVVVRIIHTARQWP
jgi:toxin ParE1/3/4